MMNELELVEQKGLREQFIERIEVLDKVKEILLLPGTEFATTQQVAGYYEIGISAIKSLIFDNGDELIEDGYVVWKAKDFNSFSKELLKIISNRGNFEVEFNN